MQEVTFWEGVYWFLFLITGLYSYMYKIDNYKKFLIFSRKLKVPDYLENERKAYSIASTVFIFLFFGGIFTSQSLLFITVIVYKLLVWPIQGSNLPKRIAVACDKIDAVIRLVFILFILFNRLYAVVDPIKLIK